MKIAFFGGMGRETDQLRIDEITGTPALYTYFLRKELQRRNVETVFCPSGSYNDSVDVLDNLPIPSADHIISVEQRGFTYRCPKSPTLYKNLRTMIKGKISTICDVPIVNPAEDMVFYAAPVEQPINKNTYIGWACDHDLLTPKQDNNVIQILIDHSYYGTNSEDLTNDITLQCLQLQKTYTNKPIIIRRFSGPTGVETITETNAKSEPYNRGTSMSYPKACEEYQKCDIFIVTHGESLGISVLESAACGAHIVTPYLFIKPPLIKEIPHTVIDKKALIPFNEIISNLDINKSRNSTIQYSWKNVVDKILLTLES